MYDEYDYNEFDLVSTICFNSFQLSAHHETMMILVTMVSITMTLILALRMIKTVRMMVMMMKTFVSAICFIGSSLVRRGK